MIYFVIFGVVLLLAIVVAAWMARGSAGAVRDISELESRLIPIDLEAFSNLIDFSELRFLRHSLAPSQFRRVQRARIAATFQYVREMALNAAVLIKTGQMVLTSPDAIPEATTAAQAMVSSALQLRLRASLALCELSVEYLVPALNISPAGFGRRYDSLSLSMKRVSALHRPQLRAVVSNVV
jgi:hypothetical protein